MPLLEVGTIAVNATTMESLVQTQQLVIHTRVNLEKSVSDALEVRTEILRV